MPRSLRARPSRASARQRLADVAFLGIAAVVAVTALAGYATFRIWSQGYTDEARPADAIVVLGAAQYDGTPSPVFQARIDHAVDLWKGGLAPWFVVTGGRAAGDRTSEAAAARAYAMSRGVPASAIIGESGGTTTLTSLLGLRALFAKEGIRSAVFVSDRGHMLRVIRMAGDLGIESYGSPTDESPSDATLAAKARATLHELGALGWYLIVGQAETRG